MRIKVFLIGPQTMSHEGLAALVQGATDMDLVGKAQSGREALLALREISPQVVILDTPLPDMDDRALWEDIRKMQPAARLIVIASRVERPLMDMIASWGVHGFLLKDVPFAELARAVRTVAGGQTFITPGMSQPPPLVNATTAGLSPREREVLRLLADGKATSQIANLLFISVKTVETHRRKIMQKLHLHSVAELTKYAIRAGLTTLEN